MAGATNRADFSNNLGNQAIQGFSASKFFQIMSFGPYLAQIGLKKGYF